MKKCSLDHFVESLGPWLDENYIRSVTLDGDGRVTFTFMDKVMGTEAKSQTKTNEGVISFKEKAYE